MGRLIAVVFHNDENRHQVGLVRDIRAGEVKPAAIVRCDSFDYQRASNVYSFEGSDALFIDENGAFDSAEEVFEITNIGNWKNNDEVLMEPRRSTSVGDLIAFYDNRGPVFVVRCEDTGWKRQPGTLFFRDAYAIEGV